MALKYKVCISSIFLVLIMVCAAVYANTSAQYTELKIFNPYSSVAIKLLVKCDHNYKTNKYRFYKTVIIRGNANVIIKAPVGLKKCEIWPIEMNMFR